MVEIKPITFASACDFINKNHRHHKATVGCKFCLSLWDKNKLVGVAVCGRPVSRIYEIAKRMGEKND